MSLLSTPPPNSNLIGCELLTITINNNQHVDQQTCCCLKWRTKTRMLIHFFWVSKTKIVRKHTRVNNASKLLLTAVFTQTFQEFVFQSDSKQKIYSHCVFSLFFFLARLDGAVNLRCIGFVFPASPVLRGKGLAANHSGLGGEGEITTMNLPTTTYQLSACVASKEDSETRVKMDCGHEKRLLFTGSERQ